MMNEMDKPKNEITNEKKMNDFRDKGVIIFHISFISNHFTFHSAFYISFFNFSVLQLFHSYISFSIIHFLIFYISRVAPRACFGR